MERDLFDSEAGLMLISEEFDFLSNKAVLRIMLALAKAGPLTRKQLNNMDIGKPYRIKNLLSFLVDEGKVVMVRSVVKKDPRKQGRSVFHYYIADEFIACALCECCDFLERSHRAFADGFARLSGELKPRV